MYWLHGVSEVIKYPHECVERPSFATFRNPLLAVILERAERNQGIVAGATPKNLCSTVTNEAVPYLSVSYIKLCRLWVGMERRLSSTKVGYLLRWGRCHYHLAAQWFHNHNQVLLPTC
jgi:hypothetical protein